MQRLEDLREFVIGSLIILSTFIVPVGSTIWACMTWNVNTGYVYVPALYITGFCWLVWLVVFWLMTGCENER